MIKKLKVMFPVFKRKKSISKLKRKYRSLLEESRVLAQTSRFESELKFLEANNVLDEIEKIKAINN